MAASQTRKRMLMILKLLYEKSDEENPLTTREISDYLLKNEISADRKTLKEDMDFVINEMNYDIVMVKSSPNKYFWGERTFEIPELKLLIDAVSSAHFIEESKSAAMIEKLMKFASEKQQENLIRNVFGTGKIKSDDKKLYYIVDTVNDAINKKKKIQFQYYDYNIKKEKVLKHNGETYTLSPYALYWNEDNYYVVGFSDKRRKISAFRVDRLHRPEVIDESAEKKPADFTIASYGNKIFRMFGGEETLVELECNIEIMKHIIDKFGSDVVTEEKTDNTFIARVCVELSPTFYGWIFQFAGQMKIRGPEVAISEYEKMKGL